MWVGEEEWEHIISLGWNAPWEKNQVSVSTKIKRVGEELKLQDKNTFGHMGKLIKLLQEKIEVTRNLSPLDQNMQRLKDLQKELNGVLAKEEIM